jgi:hypothetical protein
VAGWSVPKSLRVAFCAILLVGVWACSDVLGGGFGDLSVLVANGVDAAGEEGPTGSLHTRLQVYVREATGFWSEVTTGELTVTLPLEGTAAVEVVSRRVNIGLYPNMRVVFHSVEADVVDGLVIDGTPVTGVVTVQLPSPLTLERPIALVVDEREPMDIVIEMNAHEWLEAATGDDRQVASEIFESHVSVRAGHSP